MTRIPGKQRCECQACGAVVWRYASLARGRVFCSKACVGKDKRNGSTLHCAWCDSEFYRRFGEQDEKVLQFCSRECYQVHRSADLRSYAKIGPRHVHRVVAERWLGRPLRRGEVVHHIDCNRLNNEPSNLAVLPSQADHVRAHSGAMSDEELRGFSLIQGATSRAVGLRRGKRIQRPLSVPEGSGALGSPSGEGGAV